MKKFAALLSMVLLAGAVQGMTAEPEARLVAAMPPIRMENQKPGDPSWLITDPARNYEIEGYASVVSVNRGGTIGFFVSTADASYKLDIYRMGYYRGVGARRMLPTITTAGRLQPLPLPAPDTGLVECHWTHPYLLHVGYNSEDPTYWASGIYIVKLTGSVSGKQSYIIFVVRDDRRPSDLLFQNTVTTYQAYNHWGGRSLYTKTRAHKVSFNRPTIRATALVTSSFGNTRWCVSWNKKATMLLTPPTWTHTVAGVCCYGTKHC